MSQNFFPQRNPPQNPDCAAWVLFDLDAQGLPGCIQSSQRVVGLNGEMLKVCLVLIPLKFLNGPHRHVWSAMQEMSVSFKKALELPRRRKKSVDMKQRLDCKSSPEIRFLSVRTKLQDQDQANHLSWELLYWCEIQDLHVHANAYTRSLGIYSPAGEK